MTEVLLRELMTDDIAWLKQAGVQRTIPSGMVLVSAGTVEESFCLLLDGWATVMMPSSELDPLQRAFAAIEGETTDREIFTLECGDIFGSLPGLVAPLPQGAVVAKEDCTVLAVPLAGLVAKIMMDIGFAGRFYKFLAILLAGRLQVMLRRLERRSLAQGKLLRDVWLVFGEFHDSDVEWLMAMGEVRHVATGEVLVRAGNAIDSLYLLLDGRLLMLWEEARMNPLLQAFAAIEGRESIGQAVAELGQGALFGESPFLDGQLGRVTIQTLTDAVVLAVPRRVLLAKLQQDLGFAGRFYQVLSAVMGDRLQGVYGRLGYGRWVYTGGEEDELEMETIDRMGLAGRRFELLLGQMMKKLHCGAI
ncbi:MAG: cyclic nucleotide-binding domain-containing protein [Chamaesiphon sp.]|nr:cyclic nucleotide-binding domain-containing protein [Chamaesiphon sp.]